MDMEKQEQEYAQRLEEMVQNYYRFVDANEVDHLLDLFAQDTVYYRGSLTIQGHAALEEFYRHDRIIAKGSHSVSLNIAAPSVTTRGHFAGELKSGEPVEVDFMDEFVFDGAKSSNASRLFLNEKYDLSIPPMAKNGNDMPADYDGVNVRTLTDAERSLRTDRKRMPLVIEPKGSADLAFLHGFLRSHSDQILRDIARFGAVLLRGLRFKRMLTSRRRS